MAMAKCASHQETFSNPLPLATNPTLIESLSALHQQFQPPPPPPPEEVSSFTEIFGELHFKDQSPPQPEVESFKKILNHQFKSKPPDVSSFTELFGELYFKEPPSLPISPKVEYVPEETKTLVSDVEGLNLNLQLCTEGLGFESFDVETDERVDVREIDESVDMSERKRVPLMERSSSRKLEHSKSFPPPISSIGGNGKPWMYLKSFREDGRFILRQYTIPSQVFFNAYRENGRLRLHPVRPVNQSTETQDDEVQNDAVENDTRRETQVDEKEEKEV